jgi:hypothetical protein
MLLSTISSIARLYGDGGGNSGSLRHIWSISDCTICASSDVIDFCDEVEKSAGRFEWRMCGYSPSVSITDAIWS